MTWWEPGDPEPEWIPGDGGFDNPGFTDSGASPWRVPWPDGHYAELTPNWKNHGGIRTTRTLPWRHRWRFAWSMIRRGRLTFDVEVTARTDPDNPGVALLDRIDVNGERLLGE